MTGPQPEPWKRMVAAQHWSFVLAFLAGVGLIVLYGLAEVLTQMGVSLGDCNCDRGIPWTLFLVSGLLIAPATIGAARAASLLKEGIKVADHAVSGAVIKKIKDKE